MHRILRAPLAALLLVGAAGADANVVRDWNATMLEALVGQTPAEEQRLAAITQLAVFEAVNTITHDFQPYLGTVDAPPGASPEAAAIAAAHHVLRSYLPTQGEILDAQRQRTLATIADGPARQAGIAVGTAAADAMIAVRTDDGSSPSRNYRPESSAPGAWQLTPNCTAAGGVFLHLPDVIPFGIATASQFRAEPPPSLGSRRYEKSYEELKRRGGVDSPGRPQDRADVARFYAAVLAARTWNPVVTQLSIARGDSLAETARAYALLNMSMEDALIAVFDSKYHAPFWRPETAIRAGDRDGNRNTRGDESFAPFIGTPCHPSYPSAHASAGYAALSILERLYGRRGHFITLASPAVPDVVLTYSRIDGITDDIDDARIYGGIHFRFDQEAGARQGRRIGSYIHRHQLRRVRDHRGPPGCD